MASAGLSFRDPTTCTVLAKNDGNQRKRNDHSQSPAHLECSHEYYYCSHTRSSVTDSRVGGRGVPFYCVMICVSSCCTHLVKYVSSSAIRI
jgi:hypothetical protein